MKRVSPVFAWFLAGACAWPACGQTNPVIESPAITRTRSLVTRINLLNGLGLTGDQLEKLRRLLLEAEDVRQMMAADQARFEARCVPAFEELERHVWAGRPVPGDVYERCKALDDGNRILQNRYLRLMQPLEQRLVTRVLAPAQVALVLGHAECMVPAPDLQDPEKIGQAGDGSAYRKLLTEVRKLPAPAFEARQPQILKDLLAGVESDFGLLGPEEKRTFERRCREVLLEVRSLAAVQFAVRLGELARELDPQAQDIRLKNKRVAFDIGITGGLGKPGRLLLDVSLLPVVTDRVKAPPAAPGAPPGSRLKAGPVAESCGPKGCSVATLR